MDLKLLVVSSSSPEGQKMSYSTTEARRGPPTNVYLRRAEILDSQETGTGTLEVHSRYVWNKRGGGGTPGFWPRQMSSPGENQRALYPQWQGKRKEGSVESELFAQP